MKRLFLIMVMMLAVALIISGCQNKYITSGKIAMNTKNYDKAIQDFNLAIGQDSLNAESHFLLGTCYKEKGNTAQMLAEFDAAARLSPKYKEEATKYRGDAWTAAFNSGVKLAKDGKLDSAMADFRSCIVLMPERYEGYTNTGFVWQQLKNDDSAYVYYTKAYSLEPKNVKLLENYAGLCFTLKKYDQADTIYSKILEMDPSNAEAMARRGAIAEENKEYEKAADFYISALKIVPDNCDIWFNLGIVYFQKLKQNNKAEDAFNQAVQKCPTDVNAKVNLNVVLVSEAKYDEALKNLLTLTQENPTECTGWDLISQVYTLKGDKKSAAEAYKKYQDCTTNQPK